MISLSNIFCACYHDKIFELIEIVFKCFLRVESTQIYNIQEYNATDCVKLNKNVFTYFEIKLF